MQDWCDTPSDSDDRPSAETRGPCEYELYGPSPIEEEDIHSESTDAVLQLITQTIPPRGPMLTDSDEELLQASEHYEAQQRMAVNTGRNSNPRTRLYDIPLNDLCMNNYAPQPTTQDFNDALALTIEQWARNIIAEDTNPEHATLLSYDGIALAKIVFYINDIAPHSEIGIGLPQNFWTWLATEWMSASSLLQQIQQRMADYHPYAPDVREALRSSDHNQ